MELPRIYPCEMNRDKADMRYVLGLALILPAFGIYWLLGCLCFILTLVIYAARETDMLPVVVCKYLYTDNVHIDDTLEFEIKEEKSI